ncbi:hypothetical protein EX30DRAFT_391498 [Ascodesmis nigricans]|uniref:Uncharacterized protein n=1 Tax=Ascodesmis nigricans TaxID=341454 RepID=A0A4S2MX38_9PEZI|nr:hypothetical protein EX30DRAFT_391498 [Ascodesmis nigricans]
MRSLTQLSTLLLLTSASLAQAQLGFLRRLVGGGQQELSGKAATRINEIALTSENWLDVLNTTVSGVRGPGSGVVVRRAEAEDGGEEVVEVETEPDEEWLLYFTASGEGNQSVAVGGNVTLWDEVYKTTAPVLSTKKSNLHFGKIDATEPSTASLLSSFLLTPRQLPRLYHVSAYMHNSTLHLRLYTPPLNTSLPLRTQHLEKFVLQQRWKRVHPWTGVLNPIDGSLKSVAPALVRLREAYEVLPQWVVMILVSVIGRQVMVGAAGRLTAREREAPPTAT